MSDLIQAHGDLRSAEMDWLHLLVGDWQVISDLAFADLVLWLPTRDDDFVAVAHCRPSTGATVHYEDVVGRRAPEGQVAALGQALTGGVIRRSREPRWNGSYAIREEAIPVVRDGKAIAVIARETNLGASRTPSRLEINYVEAADDLCSMIATGEYPSMNSATGRLRGAPRVGDGLVRLNGEGEVLYASPNALSCFHRLGVLGNLVGHSLAEVVTGLIDEAELVDESLPLVVMGRAAWRTDIESRGVSLSLRAIPLTEKGARMGAVLLCRDVSELRRREQELVTKDATIREIHHRVKNNLQTVAALLRLQARRTTSDDARLALEEAMRRVATIATVHEALSQTIDEVVDFDEVFGRTLRLAADVASGEQSVRTVREGSFGPVPATEATALAVVLTELVANAVEHGLAETGGTVRILAERDGTRLVVRVIDDGVGMGPLGSPSGTGLGMQIVRTLVAGELRGTIEWHHADGGGTEVRIVARLAPLRISVQDGGDGADEGRAAPPSVVLPGKMDEALEVE
ncbi:signal transduction histidine kinase [Beutenbergia cavernae DSM 12333]|uniref:histidine kinase n=1 Tax=Beutenbergia cavernae (strain ATCC BAA-8 / DSM 12333 / CCUG 43141 / JCM 11478 / NBRC 16432 / NCIMB 13614 / HKI 0122) TaxID=471853 RepID=C5BYH4_BEUC1|nr:PAS domain-containing sensor histidine kinase [Beutenbergia cavernae]ACQ81074.1 signal transduction histidine kinase [Beutenbergia cavernae DSM 12333]